jgi:hypothetical protein
MKADGSDFDRLLLDQIADRWSILVLGAICASGGILRSCRGASSVALSRPRGREAEGSVPASKREHGQNS